MFRWNTTTQWSCSPTTVIGGGRQPDRLRQDPGGEEFQHYLCRVSNCRRRAAGDLALCRRRLRFRTSAAISCLLAVLAARELKRPVRVSLTRQQMFTFGHRPETLQRVALGAAPEQLEAVSTRLLVRLPGSKTTPRMSSIGRARFINAKTSGSATRLCRSIFIPRCDMRAPGAIWGFTRSNARWTNSPTSSGSIRLSSDLKTTPRTRPERR